MSAPTLLSRYLADGMQATEFFPRGAGAAGDRRGQVELASERRIAPELLAVIRAQNGPDGPLGSAAAAEGRAASLLALAEPGSVVVVTGQQVGLFTGPLYTLYKAATAVAWAERLARETGVACVPLFWLQTEDHDFAEIAHCTLPCKDGRIVALSLSDDPALERTSVVQRTLGADVDIQLAALAEALAEWPHAADVQALMARHYRPGASWHWACAGVLAELFPSLVFYNPRTAVAARLAAPIIKRAFSASAQIDAALERRGEQLRLAGFSEQIHLRKGAPLPFVHATMPSDGREHYGPRQRLQREGERLRVPGTEQSYSEAELFSLLDADPLRFSTSALLRPIVQDSLLPVALYVGGPAEAAYFAQMAPLYPLFDLPPPLFAPRARFRILTSRVSALLEALGLTAADVEAPSETLLPRLATSAAPAVGHWLDTAEAELRALEASPSFATLGLGRAVARTRASLQRALGRFERRYSRALLEREQTALSRLSRAQAWLFPHGEPQERVHGFMAFAAQSGPQALARAILQHVDPLAPQLGDITL